MHTENAAIAKAPLLIVKIQPRRCLSTELPEDFRAKIFSKVSKDDVVCLCQTAAVLMMINSRLMKARTKKTNSS